ncbi:MAG TPA: hypothetical protein VKV80_04610 [Streptosporangiaceae bacterium]|nr:hypothetical protein [Streptosporangiaceae bacterium]
MPFTSDPGKARRDDPRAAAIAAAARDDSHAARVRTSPAIKLACPACDALPNERCYASREPKRFARTLHAERLALVPQPAAAAEPAGSAPETGTAGDAAQPAAVKPGTRKSGDPRPGRQLAGARDARKTKKTAAAKPEPAAKPGQPAAPKPMSAGERKRAVAAAVIRAAADLAAAWQHDEITRDEATAMISAWMNYLPGDAWDDRLGQRSGAGKPRAAKA